LLVLGGETLLSARSQVHLAIPILSGFPGRFPGAEAAARAGIETEDVRPQHAILGIHWNPSAPIHHALTYLIST
jgi:hypothetical protein